MKNKKQSSIDKFVQQLKRKGLLITEDSEYIVAYLEAKAMHKEDMIQFAIKCMFNSDDISSNLKNYFIQKYNETFGGNNETH